MDFTKKQLEDLETIEYFIPEALKDVQITNDNRRMYLENSERGLRKDIGLEGKYVGHEKGVGALYEYSGFQALLWGKIWRGRWMEIYENDILSSSFIGYRILLDGMPRSVVDFMKKEMFQGLHSKEIEKTYQLTL